MSVCVTAPKYAMAFVDVKIKEAGRGREKEMLFTGLMVYNGVIRWSQCLGYENK